MKNVIVHIVVTVAALAIVVTVVSFDAGTSRGQSPTTRSKTTAVRRSNRNSSANAKASSSFAAAAANNALLKNELSWTFGGKTQSGWYLYDLLIGQTLNTQSDSVTSDFAAALAGWRA
jgi:hypothetical protein